MRTEKMLMKWLGEQWSRHGSIAYRLF